MNHSMRNRLALMLVAAAFAGMTATTEAGQTATKYQLVQQTDQSQSATDRAAGQAGAATDQAGSQMKQAGGNLSQAQLPQGITPKDYGDTRGEARDTFKSLASAALTRDNFDDLRDQLAKADRDRLATNDASYPESLNRAIDQFRQAWNQKNNQDFSYDADAALSDQYLAVTSGEVTNPQQVSQWPLPPTRQSASQIQTANPTMNQGTGVAVATFTGTPNQQPFHVSLVREGTDWKVDIPDTLTADQLKNNLAQHLNQLASMQNQWPNDRNQVQRLVTSHILMALYGIQGEQGEQGGQSGQSGTSGSPSTSGQSGASGQQSGDQGGASSQQQSSGMDQSEDQSADQQE